MDQVIELQDSIAEIILAERTRTQWQDFVGLGSLIEPLQHISLAEDNGPEIPSFPRLQKLIILACESDEEQSKRIFMLLESYCAVIEPHIFARVLANFIVDAGESYPSMSSVSKGEGWLIWALDYKQELVRRGDMVRRLWRLAKERGEGIEQLTVQRIVALLTTEQELVKGAARQHGQDSSTFPGHQQSPSSSIASQQQLPPSQQHQQQRQSQPPHGNTLGKFHDIIYMLHCGPLADRTLSLCDSESVLNALVQMRDGSTHESFENQLLILANLLSRFFHWIDSQENEECIEQLKLRVASYAGTPELFVYILDSIFRYLDGRWARTPEVKEEAPRPKPITTTSLLDINREREPIRFSSSGQTGGYMNYGDTRLFARGRSLKEREIPKGHARGAEERAFEISDLVARCIDRQDDPEALEQLMRRFNMHLGMKVDTAMVSASSSAMKHAAQQRDKILLRILSENPLYRRIMSAAMEKDGHSAILFLPVIQGMLRCSIAHWSVCRNTSPKSYPKELEEATWLTQLAAQTGLIPDPINQAVILFPLIESKDLGLLLEQCFYVLLVRNMDLLQQQLIQLKHQLHQKPGTRQYANPFREQTIIQPLADEHGPEILLLRRLIFKHATKAFHLMPLFSPGAVAMSSESRTTSVAASSATSGGTLTLPIDSQIQSS